MPPDNKTPGARRASAGGALRHLALIAMDPARTRHVLTDAHRTHLAQMARLPLTEPVCDFAGETVGAAMAEATILVTGWGCPPLTPVVLGAMPRLALIAHAGGTIKPIIPPDVFARGIHVVHAASANARPVAEFTLAAILMANKRVWAFRRLYAEARGRAAAIDALADAPIGNVGKTVGIVGASMIGRLVMAELARFDLDVCLYDPFVTPAEAAALGARAATLAELLAASDVVSVHAPLLAETRGMIDAAALASMRDGATLINTARGALIDQAALEREALSGRIDCVIDVTDPETPPPDSPLYRCPNVILTPHIAGALGLERNRLGALVVEEIERFVAGAPLRHAVDPDTLWRLA